MQCRLVACHLAFWVFLSLWIAVAVVILIVAVVAVVVGFSCFGHLGSLSLLALSESWLFCGVSSHFEAGTRFLMHLLHCMCQTKCREDVYAPRYPRMTRTTDHKSYSTVSRSISPCENKHGGCTERQLLTTHIVMRQITLRTGFLCARSPILFTSPRNGEHVTHTLFKCALVSNHSSRRCVVHLTTPRVHRASFLFDSSPVLLRNPVILLLFFFGILLFFSSCSFLRFFQIGRVSCSAVVFRHH